MTTFQRRFQTVLENVSSKLTTMDVEQIGELFNVGELRIAVENCCTQLYERDAVCSVADVNEIAFIGKSIGVDERYWTILPTE